jgi:predicted homoserine dehydrogenase-like protein
MLLAREAAGKPVTVGLIGAGKFGTMFLAQLRTTRGMHLVGVADLDVARARRALQSAGWPDEACANSLGDALAQGRSYVTEDAAALIASSGIEVILEATGHPEAGIRHALAAVAERKHIVMVTVEADALAGPLLAAKAKDAGVVYSLAWGDQPALICEHVDWARTCGFTVVAAGKGTRYEPHYRRSTPDTVWDILDKYLHIEDRDSINPKMSMASSTAANPPSR